MTKRCRWSTNKRSCVTVCWRLWHKAPTVFMVVGAKKEITNFSWSIILHCYFAYFYLSAKYSTLIHSQATPPQWTIMTRLLDRHTTTKVLLLMSGRDRAEQPYRALLDSSVLALLFDEENVTPRKGNSDSCHQYRLWNVLPSVGVKNVQATTITIKRSHH